MFVLESLAFEDPGDETMKAMQMGSDHEISWLASEGSFLLDVFLVDCVLVDGRSWFFVGSGVLLVMD